VKKSLLKLLFLKGDWTFYIKLLDQINNEPFCPRRAIKGMFINKNRGNLDNFLFIIKLW